MRVGRRNNVSVDFQLDALPRIRGLVAGALFKYSLLLGASGVAYFLAGAIPGEAVSYRMAVLQGIDKVTARVSTIKAPIGSTIHFGTLEIIVRHCDKRLPEELPESAAFMEILEVRPAETAISLFSGWMLASSPALSALEHPVYDILVLDCGGAEDVGSENSKTSGERYAKDVNLPGLQKLLEKKINKN